MCRSRSGHTCRRCLCEQMFTFAAPARLLPIVTSAAEAPAGTSKHPAATATVAIRWTCLLEIRRACRRRPGTPARSAPSRRAAVPLVAEPVERLVELRLAAVLLGVGARGDRRAVLRLEVLAVVAGTLEGGDLEHRRARACATRRGRRTARARGPRCPTAAAAARPAEAAARTAPSSRNSAPIMPSGVQFSIPIVPPGRQTRTSSSATSWWWGANIAPIDDMTTSNDSSSNGRFSASACDPLELEPARLRAAPARLEQLGRQVARGHARAALRRRDRGVAGAGGDVEHAHARADAARLDEPRARAAAGTSRPSTGSRPTPTSCDGGP